MDDCYAVLEVASTASIDDITKSYRRLALLRHPDRNLQNSNATARFQLLQNAYETLKDPALRVKYDRESYFSRKTPQPQHQPQQRNQEHTNTDQKRSERTVRLQRLQEHSRVYFQEILSFRQQISVLQAEIERLNAKDKEDDIRKESQDSWWMSQASLMLGDAKPSEAEEQKLEQERLQRIARRRIREQQVEQLRKQIIRVDGNLQEANSKIRAERMEEEAESMEDFLKTAQGAHWRQDRAADNRRMADLWQEFERIAAEQDRRQAERAARKRYDDAAAELRHKKEETAQQRARETQEKEAEGPPGGESKGRKGGSKKPKNSRPCKHNKYWPKLEGSFSRARCGEVTVGEAFQCPDCKITTCLECRQLVRGEKAKNGTG